MKEKTARNKQIKREYRLGLGTILGNRYGIKRQRIHQIIHTTQMPQDRWDSVLVRRLVDWVKKIVKGG